MPRFKHPPLASATNEIRLLSLDPSGDLDDIHCTLVTHHLDAQPAYCALSYEWGDPDLPMEIKVNGNVFHARHNLWLFLHQLKAARRSQGKSSWGPTSKLWIDALCIDQTDLAERSAQVQLMGTIYRKACGVIVWLGWSDGLDPTVTSTLAKKISNDPVYGHESYGDLLLNGPSRQIAVHDEATFLQVCDFILHLCKKTYWTRRWIVQEILLAQKVLLVYGEQELPWPALCVMFERYDTYVQGHPERKVPGNYGTDLSSLRTILESTAARIWRHQGMRSGSKSGTNLASLLHDYRSLQCEALHDKIYALRSLISEELLDTDYSLSSRALYSRVFAIVLRHDRSVFDHWRDYAADCSFVIRPLSLPNMSKPDQSISMEPSVPLRTACQFWVISTMEFEIFEQGATEVQRNLYSDFRSDSSPWLPPLEQAHDIVSQLVQALARLSRLDRFVCKLPQTKAVGSIRSEDDRVPARYHPTSAKDETRLFTAATMRESPLERETRGPTMVICHGTFPWAESSLAVTWSDVLTGDMLCHVVGGCYLILRQVGEHVTIVGPVWMLLRKDHSVKLGHAVREMQYNKETREVSPWEYLFKRFISNQRLSSFDFSSAYKDRAWGYFRRNTVQLRFDIMDLTSLLQATEQMAKVTNWNNWDFPPQYSKAENRRSLDTLPSTEGFQSAPPGIGRQEEVDSKPRLAEPVDERLQHSVLGHQNDETTVRKGA